MTDQITLRLKAREALQAGRLPPRFPERICGIRGGGAYCCAICGESVQREELGYELAFIDAIEGPTDNYFVHDRCFAAWEFAWIEAAQRQGSEQSRHAGRSAESN
jgi:hypothetical protein